MAEQKLTGIYRATVYSNKDPLNQNRLRLQIPQVLGDQITEWVWPVRIEGLNTQLPEPGQGVWVMFEGGDQSFPIWTGVFGKPQNTNLPMAFRHLAASEIIERIAFLFSLKPASPTGTQLDVVDTLLNIAKKLTERNYISLYDTTSQPAAAINTPQVITINTVDFASNTSIVDGSKITIDNVGTYNLQWSGQFSNTDASDHDVRVWLRYNGVDYPNSASVLTIPGKHGSIPGHVIAAWNWLGKSQTSGDYVQIVWSSASTAVSLTNYPAGEGGPAAPSVIVTLTECE